MKVKNNEKKKKKKKKIDNPTPMKFQCIHLLVEVAKKTKRTSTIKTLVESSVNDAAKLGAFDWMMNFCLQASQLYGIEQDYHGALQYVNQAIDFSTKSQKINTVSQCHLKNKKKK